MQNDRIVRDDSGIAAGVLDGTSLNEMTHSGI